RKATAAPTRDISSPDPQYACNQAARDKWRCRGLVTAECCRKAAVSAESGHSWCRYRGHSWKRVAKEQKACRAGLLPRPRRIDWCEWSGLCAHSRPTARIANRAVNLRGGGRREETNSCRSLHLSSATEDRGAA